jgi:hypothetical protein
MAVAMPLALNVSPSGEEQVLLVGTPGTPQT